MFTKGHKINVGRKRTKETKEKLRRFHLGKKMSVSAKQKMSLAKKGKKPKNWDKVKDFFLNHKRTAGSFVKGTSWEQRFGKEKSQQMLISIKERFGNKRQSIQQRELKRLSQLGEKGSNWQGGKTKINHRHHHPTDLRLKLWIKAVFERDNYTCRKCGKQGGYLQADHIKEWVDYPELRYEVSNGQTLCLDCHKKKTALYLQNKLTHKV